MKILVIQMKMIGDVLTSSILFEALRKEFPNAELHYLVNGSTLPVIKNNPFIDKVIIFSSDQKAKKLFQLVTELKRNKYWAVVDVYAVLYTALITKLTNAQYRISYKKWYTDLCCNYTFSRNIEVRTSAGAAIEKRLRLLSPLSSNIPAEIKPKIFLTSKEIHDAEVILNDAGINLSQPTYMISALGSSASKTYPIKYLAELLDKIVQETGADLLFNYLPIQKAEVEKLYQLCTKETRKKIHLYIYGKNLREFLAFTYHCNGLIGNEGGAVNMAKAMEIPTFSIFSPQIKKENWNIYENGKTNVSVHLRDFNPKSLQNLSQKEILKNTDTFYALLKPNLIFAKLESFLKETS